MSERYYLGLDQGTTGTTALLFDEKFQKSYSGYKEVTQHYPAPGLVEHDGIELYNTLIDSTKTALEKADADASQIKCIGIDNQGETIILWDKKTGIPVYPAIVWQDRRTAKEVDVLNREYSQFFYGRTGLKLDSYFGATKIRWILQNVPEAQKLLKEHRLAAGPLDSWFIFKLTGGKSFVTDCVTASRTCLLNIETLNWDTKILSLLDIPLEILPEIKPNVCNFGMTDPDCFLGISVPITASIVDQQAALIGQGCYEKGSVKTTFGTGCFMLLNTGNELKRNDKGLLSTLALYHNNTPSFALDGGIYIAGAAVKWLKNGLKIINSSAESDVLAMSVADNGGVYFVPAFTGLAAPYWDSYARGMMIGITGGTTNAHIARATLEAMAYQVKDIFDLMKSISPSKITSMRADGGSTKSEFLMQFQADMLGIPVEIPAFSESTGFGTAFLAALGFGDVSSISEVSDFWKCDRVFEPKMSVDNRDSLLHQWHRAVERARQWAEEK